MGKAVIVIFFVLAFVVFAFIKAAATGVKKAYQAVNEPDNLKPMPKIGKNINDLNETQNKVSSITDLINNTLDVQLAISGQTPGNLPSDDFVLGYLIGYSDAIMQVNDIENNTPDGFAIATITFIHQFGNDDGPKLFSRYMDKQTSMPTKMGEGLMAGGQDMLTFLQSKGDKPPMQLTGYFLEKR
jgi:hypothetical protein